ncbi:hypothetical protein BDN72DRAFT_571143 [Pluteus cervinus]|uniref:Uncharacterized protein n=1 Tax=Pluteus cervinus TaxID=181527 RepID=A0ACD3A3B2_9AGAR|nr:hypothetical protein BDN72DRAFT_571143 [Pluteus cervinus]
MSSRRAWLALSFVAWDWDKSTHTLLGGTTGLNGRILFYCFSVILYSSKYFTFYVVDGRIHYHNNTALHQQAMAMAAIGHPPTLTTFHPERHNSIYRRINLQLRHPEPRRQLLMNKKLIDLRLIHAMLRSQSRPFGTTMIHRTP